MTVPLYNLTDTWNNGATVFTAIKMNVTDTASDAASLLMDLQEGGLPIFQVTKGLPGTIRIYNAYTDSSNYERGVFDWTTAANILTIGTQKAGTGSDRPISLIVGSTERASIATGGISSAWGISATGGASLSVGGGNLTFGSNSCLIFWTNGAVIKSPVSTNLYVDDYSQGGSGYISWGGLKRVTSDFNTGNTTTLADITGLTTNVVAGRSYSFEAILYTTSNVAAGVKFAIAGTATATNIVYECLVNSAGAIVVQTRASALATAVGAITAVTAAYVRITGTITVNAAGTLTVQMAQNVGNATGSVTLRGSTFIVYDMP